MRKLLACLLLAFLFSGCASKYVVTQETKESYKTLQFVQGKGGYLYVNTSKYDEKGWLKG